MHEFDTVAQVCDGVKVVSSVWRSWRIGGCVPREREMPKACGGIACACENVAWPVVQVAGVGVVGDFVASIAEDGGGEQRCMREAGYDMSFLGRGA